VADETVFSQMWDAYRGVIIHSIVTSFGLDFIVHDQYGGDVDTIHGVRESGQFKNALNAAAYESRSKYDGVAYHHNDAYDSTIRAARDSHAFLRMLMFPETVYSMGRHPASGQIGAQIWIMLFQRMKFMMIEVGYSQTLMVWCLQTEQQTCSSQMNT